MKLETIQNENLVTHASPSFGAPSHAVHAGPGQWQRLVARPRLDLSNFEEIQAWVASHIERREHWLVLDLKGTRFMSLAVIRYLENLSVELRRQGGALALLAMPDKTRRIFEIYGSLKNIYLADKVENLKRLQDSILSPFFREF